MGVFSIREWRTFRKIVAISGIIQGFIWLILAILCIVFYWTNTPEYIKSIATDTEPTYNKYLIFILYASYLDRDYKPDEALNPLTFHIVAWLYAFTSTCMFNFSVYEIVVLRKRKFDQYIAHRLLVFGLVFGLTCIIDLVGLGLLIPRFTNPKIAAGAQIIVQQQVLLIVLLLFTRVFAIWVFNCVVAALLVTLSVKIFKAPPILQYENGSIPRPRVHKRPHSHVNAGYIEDSILKPAPALNQNPPQSHPSYQTFDKNNDSDDNEDSFEPRFFEDDDDMTPKKQNSKPKSNQRYGDNQYQIYPDQWNSPSARNENLFY